MSASFPVLFLPHGGGPMPLLGDPAQAELSAFLQGLGDELPRPEAIVLVSAHWEEPVASVYVDASPALLYDYYNFPPEAYRIEYPAPGSPALAARLSALLRASGLECRPSRGRGYDHGMFVPLKLLFPAADIPCVQLSLLADLDADSHLRLGEALRELRDEGVAIIGSGMSFHNLKAIFSGPRAELREASDAFADWLGASLCAEDASPRQRLDALRHWREAPNALFCHPRPEHLLPLHVCAGAAGGEKAELIFDRPVMGHRVLGCRWD